MGTTTVNRTDADILHDVTEELLWDARLQPHEIAVGVRDGIVTLAGWADSFAKNRAAERAAHRVRGVKAVVNDIEVRLAAAAQRPDPEIAMDAVRALRWNTSVPMDRVEVTVTNNWVTLRGDLEWDYQRQDAERAVHRLIGVRGVTNLLTVNPGHHPSSEELRNKIEGALIRSAETDAGRIGVEVQGDRVVLAGQVRSWAQRREAERVAWSAPGVTAVDDRIVVAP